MAIVRKLPVCGPQVLVAASIQQAARNLLERGWTQLEIPSISRRFEPVVSSFIHMTNDPHPENYQIHDERELDSDGEPDLGLIVKTKGQFKKHPRPDEVAEGRLLHDETKYLFHYKDRVLGYLGNTPGIIEAYPEFFLHTARMFNESVLLGIAIAEELDKLLPGYNFTSRLQKNAYDHTLRLIRYLCDGSSPGIAQRHRDKNFLTVHIRSDRGGLWLADKNDMIIPDAEETRSNSVLLFFGRKMWEITRGKHKGIVHGVTDTTFDDLTGRMPRHTAVAFLHAEVRPDEIAWAHDHMRELRIPSHIDRFGLSS